MLAPSGKISVSTDPSNGEYVPHPNPDIEKIRKSVIVFCGHQQSNMKFINDKYHGAPDYIFKDSGGNYFVVEEKFHKHKDPRKNNWSYEDDDDPEVSAELETEIVQWENHIPTFFKNHIIQLVSYLKNIQEYKITYGYLIYWYYDFNKTEPYIHKVSTKKISLTKYYDDFYKETVEQLNQFRKGVVQKFDSKSLNIIKCAGCVVNKYCGHKTGEQQSVNIPYSIENLRLKYIDFPEELRKT